MLSVLRAHGFDASAANLEHAQVFPSLRLALGGFPIYVPMSQSEDARDFLNELEMTALEEDLESVCPKCGGVSKPKPWRIVSWIFCIACTIGIELRGRQRECRQFAHSWYMDPCLPLTDDEIGYKTNSGLEEFQLFLKAVRSLGDIDQTHTMDEAK